MGNSDEKPKNEEKPVPPIEIPKQEKKMDKPYPINSGRNSKLSKKASVQNIQKKNKNQSRGQSSLSNIHQQNQHQHQPSVPSINNMLHQSRSEIEKENPHQRDSEEEKSEEKVILPMEILPPQGNTPILIQILTLTPVNTPKAAIQKITSKYEGNLVWARHENDIFQFTLQEDERRRISMKVDLQANILNNYQDLWAVVCPLDVLFDRNVKIGQFNCSHFYAQFDEELNNEQISPSLKSIQPGIDQNLFNAWGQSFPSFLKQLSIQKKPEFREYKQINRYFDSQNKWCGSSFIQQRQKYFQLWTVQNKTHKLLEKLSLLLEKDVKNRENNYCQNIVSRFPSIQEQKVQSTSL